MGISTTTNGRRALDEGFTLIELLVVVLIIGLLAAIGIPAFLAQRESAWEATVETDLHNAVIAAENFAADNNGAFDGLVSEDLDEYGYVPSESVVIEVEPSGSSFVMTGSNTNITPARWWTYSSATGVISE